MISIRTALCAVVLATATFKAQTELPAFEAASIKPRTGEPAFSTSSSPDRFVNPDATLASLIRWAYDLQDFQVIGGPDWIRSRRFDVSARAPARASESDMGLMLRRLLAERFELRTHTETRQMPTYALVRAGDDGRVGERLKPSKVDCPSVLASRGSAIPERAPGEPLPSCLWRVGFTAVSATMILDGAPIAQLATYLQRMVRRVVLDETGLAGTFDIQLEFAPEQMPTRLPVPTDSQAVPRDGLSVFTALEEQLGLKLESRRGPVLVIIVDQASPPSPD